MDVSIMVCPFVLGASETYSALPPQYMGETQALVWREAQDYGFSAENA